MCMHVWRYATNAQALGKENRLLKHSVEKLELENHDLKRSVYELTLKYVHRITCCMYCYLMFTAVTDITTTLARCIL